MSRIFIATTLLAPIALTADVRPVFGPETLQRDYGKPQLLEKRFQVADPDKPAGQLVLKIRPDERLALHDRKLVALSSFEINGISLDWQIRKMMDRYPHDHQWQVPVLLDKQNIVRVLLRGNPDAEVTLSVEKR